MDAPRYELTPLYVLPVQFYSDTTKWSSEQLLMYAVLENAVTQYLRHKGKSSRRAQRLTLEVVDWLTESDYCSLYSFTNICQVFGFEPAYVRKCILARPHKGQGRRVAA
jgi:hypothetical protein